jgi:hypothetical protein
MNVIVNGCNFNHLRTSLASGLSQQWFFRQAYRHNVPIQVYIIEYRRRCLPIRARWGHCSEVAHRGNSLFFQYIVASQCMMCMYKKMRETIFFLCNNCHFSGMMEQAMRLSGRGKLFSSYSLEMKIDLDRIFIQFSQIICDLINMNW